jgi:hypothetical protein
MGIPIGIDPAETWEVDYCEEAAQHSIGLWRENIALARAELEAAAGDGAKTAAAARVASAEKGLADEEAKLAAYARGSGPTFVVGWVPPSKRAEIAGMMLDAQRAATERERMAARHAWRREVVRWAVRGHANLRNAKGEQLPFDGVAAELGGEKYTNPTERQLTRYGFLGSLADVCLAAQKLSELEKNG